MRRREEDFRRHHVNRVAPDVEPDESSKPVLGEESERGFTVPAHGDSGFDRGFLRGFPKGFHAQCLCEVIAVSGGRLVLSEAIHDVLLDEEDVRVRVVRFEREREVELDVVLDVVVPELGGLVELDGNVRVARDVVSAVDGEHDVLLVPRSGSRRRGVVRFGPLRSLLGLFRPGEVRGVDVVGLVRDGVDAAHAEPRADTDCADAFEDFPASRSFLLATVVRGGVVVSHLYSLSLSDAFT